MARYSDADAPIKKAGMMPPMLEACPSFLPEWERFLGEWQDEEYLPLHVALDYLARHVGGLVDRNELDELPRIFDVVERWHLEGEQYVREAATIGFLESLIRWDPKEQKQQQTLERYFRPETKRYWSKLLDFWIHGILIAED